LGIFYTDFKQTLYYKILRKLFQWVPRCSTWTDWKSDSLTDITKLIIVFRKFANTPQNMRTFLADFTLTTQNKYLYVNYLK